MPISIIGNNTGGPTNTYFGSNLQIVSAPYQSSEGDVVRYIGQYIKQFSRITAQPYFIVHSATNDMSVGMVAQPYFDKFQWIRYEDLDTYVEKGMQVNIPLVANEYNWVGGKPSASYMATGNGANTEEIASVDTTGVTPIGATTSTTKKALIWGEILNTDNVESVAVVGADTGDGSLLQGTSGVALIEWKDCSSILGLVSVNANGTFTIDRVGNQTFEYRLDGGNWQTCAINDQADGL